jgi:CorA-like Mg2+ transporter protein
MPAVALGGRGMLIVDRFWYAPPTLVAGMYGMNFKHMPELDWAGEFPTARC